MTRRWMLALTALCLLAPLEAFADDAAAKGLEIAKKERDGRKGFVTESAELEMVLIDANGTSTSRKMATLTAEQEGDGDRSRLEVTWPADVQGTRLLTWTHHDKQDDQWLYLPAVSMTKRIAGGNKSAAFMGSEFAFEDFSAFEVEKFTYAFQEETEVDGRKVWKYERFPTDPKSGYTRQVVWSDQEYLGPVKIEYYDRKNELLKVAEYGEFRDVGGFWAPERVHVKNVQTRKESKLLVTNRQVGVELDPNLFLSHALGD